MSDVIKAYIKEDAAKICSASDAGWRDCMYEMVGKIFVVNSVDEDGMIMINEGDGMGFIDEEYYFSLGSYVIVEGI